MRRLRGPRRRRDGARGAAANDTNPLRLRDEPDDHGIGRSRGGLSTKTHLIVDGAGRPLVIAVAAGQGGDSPMLIPLLSQLSVPRLGSGPPRTRPVSLAGDKAYSSKAIRAHLRSRRIVAVIPEPGDQIGHRLRRGARGGRPVGFDPVAYRNRNVIERAFNTMKNWRGLATRYDKHAVTYRGAVVLAAILAWLRG